MVRLYIAAPRSPVVGGGAIGSRGRPGGQLQHCGRNNEDAGERTREAGVTGCDDDKQ